MLNKLIHGDESDIVFYTQAQPLSDQSGLMELPNNPPYHIQHYASVLNLPKESSCLVFPLRLLISHKT